MRVGIRTWCRSLLLIATAAACDTNVSNPGPVQDEFLAGENIYGAANALVNGAGRAVGVGLNWVGYTGAAITREVHPAGSTGSFGITNRWQNGELNADDTDLNDHWETTNRGRWVAEEAVRRLLDQGPPASGQALTVTQYNNILQLAHLYAGFANRILGENMCEAVFDGGPAQANREYFLRAEDHFTKAIEITAGTPATIAAQANAAYAGRAAARVFLDKWTEAVADAGRVPIGFVLNMPYYNIGEDAQRNRIFWASGNSRESGSAYRAHTQWNTWHRDYQLATNDPRVPISTTTLVGDAAIECCGRVPFYPQNKHPNSQAPIRLASGREMRLIEAEAHLRNNDPTAAMNSINQVRTAAGAGTITATDQTDAWRLLKRERGIELWLEGRRLGDRRRWAAANTPGALDPLELPGPASHLARQDLCFPIPPAERQTNPNLQ
jgi:hypothetical protein